MSKYSHDKRDEKIDNFRAWAMSRRDLIKIAGMGLTALAGTKLPGIPTCAQAFAMSDKETEAAQGPIKGFAPKPNKPQYLLRIGGQELNPDHAKPVAAITANGALPAPEIRVKEGEYLRIQVENR
jgi:FtsP/CotA-like multicopper oxidase with cupredoxin domain